MVTLIIGKKGSGKTKKLIQLANEAVARSSGNVVVIDKGPKLTYDVTHKARLIDTDAYGVKGYEMLYGFISGICAGNYDVTDIFVDSTFKIATEGVAGIEAFVTKLNELEKETDANITLLVSAGEEALPTGLSAVCEEI